MLWSSPFAIGGIIFLLPTKFFLFSDHLRYLYSQKKFKSRHARWVEFINEYSFFLKHRSGVENKVADALSRVLTVLQMMSAQVIGFDRMKDEYSTCPDFGLISQEVRDA